MNTNKLIIIGIVLLLILIFLSQILKSSFKLQNPTPSPRLTPINTNFTYQPNSKTFKKNQFDKSKKVNQNNPIQFRNLNNDQLEAFFQLQKKMPFENADFSVSYSYLLEKFIIEKKTTQAVDKFINYLKENNYDNLIEEDIFIFTDKPLNDYINEQEKVIYLNKNEIIKENIKENINLITKQINENIINYPESNTFQKDETISIAEFLKIIFENIPSPYKSTNFPTITSTVTENFPTITTTVTEKINSNSPKFITTNLDQIFTEASQKVGVPKRILEAIVTIENASTFRLSSEEITQYSKPGNYWPKCGPNHCSATGPTQITIGIDHKGSPKCSSCGSITACPNQWLIYGKAVNKYAGDSHQALPCNIRDNIFASAAKLKNDSRASDPQNWTKDQVYKAARHYYGNCTDRHPHVGNRTYCEFLWDYYQNKY